jgi:hypothetical protein
MGDVNIREPLYITGDPPTDMWLRQGIMADVYLDVCEILHQQGRSDIARLLDNKHITIPIGYSLMRAVPPTLLSKASGIRNGGGTREVRARIEEWKIMVKEILYAYVMYANEAAAKRAIIQTLSLNRILAEHYLGPFHDQKYVPLWNMECGELVRVC